MRCRHQERLWKEYLRDPSLWWDIRNIKTSPGSADFKHKFTQELLWLHGTQNATRITENKATLNKIDSNWTLQKVPTPRKEEEKEGRIVKEKKIVGSISNAEEKLLEVPTSRRNAEQHIENKEENGEEKKVNVINMASPSLQEIVTALEEVSLPLPSAADMSCILRMCENEREPSHVQCLHAMLKGYMKSGKPEDALRLYQLMRKNDNAFLDGSVFVALIKACANLKDMENGCELHSELARIGLVERDPFVGSSLLDMYVKCGFIAKAEEVFKDLRNRDVVVWNALLGGYIKLGHLKKALDFYEQMQIEPDAVTYVFALKACCSMRAIAKGREVHAEIERKGLLERDLYVASVLIDMYAKCGFLTMAREVLDKRPMRDVVCWTALITGYAEHGHGDACLDSLEKMNHEGMSPNIITLMFCLKACGSLAALDKATEIHAEIERRGLLEKDCLLGSALVDMYAKVGSLVKAQETFNTLPARNVFTWTALVSGCVELGHFEEALDCFAQMRANFISPDAISFVSSLKACGSLGAIDKGLEIHAEIERQGLSITDHTVGNVLVDTYARCGSLAMAQCVFDKLPVQSTVAWNSLLAGYAQVGDSESVFSLFDRMLEAGVKPDLVTFVIVLDACSQVGLYSKGDAYLKAMSKEYEILPVLEHHTCMLDLLGRAGLLEKAVELIKKLPVSPDLAVWHSVLGACRKWGNVILGREAFEHAVGLDEQDGAAYVMMSSIYANANMEKEAKNIQAMRVEKRAWKRARRCLQT